MARLPNVFFRLAWNRQLKEKSCNHLDQERRPHDQRGMAWIWCTEVDALLNSHHLTLKRLAHLVRAAQNDS